MRSIKIILVSGTAILFAVSTWAFGQSMMSVQVKNGQLRATASFMGQIVGRVDYGDRVDVVRQQGDWMQVKTAQGTTGWIHQSALTRKRIAMTAGSQNVQTAASGDELALAGKGFNSDVEAQFKAKNKVDYSWVDWMEKIKVSPSESTAFLKEGGVTPPKGGVQ